MIWHMSSINKHHVIVKKVLLYVKVRLIYDIVFGKDEVLVRFENLADSFDGNATLIGASQNTNLKPFSVRMTEFVNLNKFAQELYKLVNRGTSGVKIDVPVKIIEMDIQGVHEKESKF